MFVTSDLTYLLETFLLLTHFKFLQTHYAEQEAPRFHTGTSLNTSLHHILATTLITTLNFVYRMSIVVSPNLHILPCLKQINKASVTSDTLQQSSTPMNNIKHITRSYLRTTKFQTHFE